MNIPEDPGITVEQKNVQLERNNQLLLQRIVELESSTNSLEREIKKRDGIIEMLTKELKKMAKNNEKKKKEKKRERGDGGKVKLNVGGQIFQTTLETLSHYPGSMLNAMFSGKFNPYDDEDGYFIDRDGTLFGFILNFLRDSSIVLPNDESFSLRLLKEAEYYQISDLIYCLKECLEPGSSCKEYVTVRYMPGSTYDGWPMRIEGPLESSILAALNDGDIPPERESDQGMKKMYGNFMTGWKVRGIFLTKVLNTFAQHGLELVASNGSGAGGTSTDTTKSFAEMYVFSRKKQPLEVSMSYLNKRKSSEQELLDLQRRLSKGNEWDHHESFPL